MTTWGLILLTFLFFATSVVGVVTGSNSLVTVPVMFQFGIDEKIAVATNMFGLTFMAVGGSIPFLRRRTVDLRRLAPMIGLTIIGSAIGAALVGVFTNLAIKMIVFVAMVVIVLFTVLHRDVPSDDAGSADASKARTGMPVLALSAAFLLAIYGGLYSGGYVTVLTSVLVAFSGMTFGQSIAATKVINVFSSGIATLVFMWQGLVDYKLGIILAVAMFAGAFIGAHFAARMNETWLRRIFLITVLLLAAKTLFDFL